MKNAKRSCDVCGRGIRDNNRHGVCGYTQECERERERRQYHANPGHAAAKHHHYHATERGKLTSAIAAAKKRATAKGVPFDLTPENLPAIPDRCPLLDIPLERGVGKVTPGSPSLDRIIPELGYVPGNVWWISHRANIIKSDATPAELRQVADALDRMVLPVENRPDDSAGIGHVIPLTKNSQFSLVGG